MAGGGGAGRPASLKRTATLALRPPSPARGPSRRAYVCPSPPHRPRPLLPRRPPRARGGGWRPPCSGCVGGGGTPRGCRCRPLRATDGPPGAGRRPLSPPPPPSTVASPGASCPPPADRRPSPGPCAPDAEAGRGGHARGPDFGGPWCLAHTSSQRELNRSPTTNGTHTHSHSHARARSHRGTDATGRPSQPTRPRRHRPSGGNIAER